MVIHLSEMEKVMNYYRSASEETPAETGLPSQKQVRNWSKYTAGAFTQTHSAKNLVELTTAEYRENLRFINRFRFEGRGKALGQKFRAQSKVFIQAAESAALAVKAMENALVDLETTFEEMGDEIEGAPKP